MDSNRAERFIISGAVASDVPYLLAMIRELAVFEKLEHEITVTCDSLHEALFGPDPAAKALIARIEGEAAGYAVYYRTFSTFVGRAGIFLEDIYVRSPYRNRGLGRALLEQVAKDRSVKIPGRFEWVALRWNENALRFYRSLGAELLEDWVWIRMAGEPLTRMVEEES